MQEVTSIEQAMQVIKLLQQQLIDLDTTGKEYEFQLEQTIEVLKQELEHVQKNANETITKLEIQIDELQEQNRQWESKYLAIQEQNGNMLQDKLILQCELEQMREEITRLKMEVQYEIKRPMHSDSMVSSQPPDITDENTAEDEPSLSLHQSISKTNIKHSLGTRSHIPIDNVIGLPNQTHNNQAQPIRVMFKGPSLLLQSLASNDAKSIVPSLSQATVVATTSSQSPRR